MASPWFCKIQALRRESEKNAIIIKSRLTVFYFVFVTSCSLRVCNFHNFWTKYIWLVPCAPTDESTESGNFAKSWGRHPSIMKKKCIKKFSFYLAQPSKQLLSDKYQLHKAAQIFFTLNTFIFKRKWSKLVILLWVIIRIIKVCTLKMCPLQIKF